MIMEAILYTFLFSKHRINDIVRVFYMMVETKEEAVLSFSYEELWFECPALILACLGVVYLKLLKINKVPK